jgi:hypothetical protein
LVRLLQQFDNGSGDYTKERFNWLKDADVERASGKSKNATS